MTSTSKQPSPLYFTVAVADQATHITTLINAAFRSEPTGQTWLFDDQSKRIDILPPGVTEDLITSPDSLMLVGTAADNIVPIATCFLRKPSTPPQAHMSEGAAWFGLLAVQPEYHGKGYGIAMLREAERYVREEWGVDKLEMDYVNARTELAQWYHQCGYEPTGKVRDFPYGDGGREILADGLEMVVLGKKLE
ncbi:hypothetical protein E4T39_08549 [Aureobasidium subglaciale]|nr:hypothetical protein E4T39_08549 [Aureobasidium subglaciale]